MIGSDHRDSRLPTPGSRVCIETYGCSYNVSDSETMAGVLENAGYTLADSVESADAVILNSCTVKGRTFREFVKDFAGLLADVFRSPRFYRFLHIPVQSGSDSVLARMGRAYTAGEFLEITEAVRARLPEATLATDVIAGFPGETDADFDATMSLMRRIATPVINRSRFSPRPGTRAARMEPLPAGVVSRRSKQLSALALGLARQALHRWVGWQGTVIVEETLRPGLALARNDTYTPVIVEGPFESGARLQVRVVCVENFHVCGIPIEGTVAPEGFGHCALATAQADCAP